VFDGYVAGDLGTSWSVAKSFYAAAVGVAIDEGLITSLDQRASDFLSEWKGTDKENIPIRVLLEMRAGLPGEGTDLFSQADQSAFALNQDLVNQPGVTFLYSNTTSQLLEPLIRRATGEDAHTYLAKKILTPIGIDMSNVGLWFDPTGTNPMTYCCIDMRPEDFARFGVLFARGGRWAGTRLISSDFVSQSLTAQSDYYGLHWWVLNANYFGGYTPPVQVKAVVITLSGEALGDEVGRDQSSTSPAPTSGKQNAESCEILWTHINTTIRHRVSARWVEPQSYVAHINPYRRKYLFGQVGVRIFARRPPN
jgi:CubicO group peptidase (beta-lactamase class C family)